MAKFFACFSEFMSHHHTWFLWEMYLQGNANVNSRVAFLDMWMPWLLLGECCPFVLLYTSHNRHHSLFSLSFFLEGLFEFLFHIVKQQIHLRSANAQLAIGSEIATSTNHQLGWWNFLQLAEQKKTMPPGLQVYITCNWWCPWVCDRVKKVWYWLQLFIFQTIFISMVHHMFCTGYS